MARIAEETGRSMAITQTMSTMSSNVNIVRMSMKCAESFGDEQCWDEVDDGQELVGDPTSIVSPKSEGGCNHELYVA
jgi:hypothetical protein